MNMTVEEAIQAVHRVGTLDTGGGQLRYEVPKERPPEIDVALATLRTNRDAALIALNGANVEDVGESKTLETFLKGSAVELWSDALGERFWLVADEEDAAKLGEPRGTVYTAPEARRVIQIGDPATVAEIHEWKRRFDGVIR